MPLYEYECQTCGKRIEALQRFSDPPLESCSCGDEGKLKKLISAPAFQFKGDGWYVTDYARKGNGKEKKEGADKVEAKDSGGKDSGGKESGGKDSGGKESKEATGEGKSAGAAGKTKPERTST
jgi:putative FmdB family regulatory protein